MLNVQAQVTPVNNEQHLDDRIELNAENSVEGMDFDELKIIWDEFAKRPINLNKTTKEQLQQLALLTDYQIDQLLQHRQKNGDLIALQELQAVNGFDADDIQRILPFVTVTTNVNDLHLSFSQYITQGNHQLLLRTESVLNEQAGYNPKDSNDASYAGSPYRLYMRYRIFMQRKYSFGIVAEKDPGESLLTDNNKWKGFDYYSAHLFVRDIGIVKSLAIGDYQVEYGQGLTLWSGLAFGKSADPVTVIRFANGLRPYTSVNETIFRRGIAVSLLPAKNWRVDAYYSNRLSDGNVATIDSLNQISEFTSIQSSGLHRTDAELADKGSVRIQSYGGHITYRKNQLEVGFTGAATHLNKNLQRTYQLYNQFQFSGQNFFNTGIDYKLLLRNFNFFGEISRSQNGAMATINGVIMSVDPKLTFTLLYRNYGKKYEAIESNAIAESDNVNERGLYAGYSFKPVRKISLTGYFDLFSYPWLRFAVNAPSHGFEYITQLTYKPNKQLEMYARYRQTNKQGNVAPAEDAPKIDYLVNNHQQNLRFNIAYKISKVLAIRSRVEWVYFKDGNQPLENGFLAFQDFIYKPLGKPLSITIRYAVFGTKSYNSRLYAYENDVYGAFSIPPLYGQGQRFYALLRYHISRQVDLFLRYSQTVYYNQTTIGSGLDKIEGNSRNDIKLVLKMEL
ncbi:MAG: helix-hairpin-helix domain-containing protein [Bacteroidia bacterium]|nr:helix-hairpin-helix domain-containing protein [Bacteroidia bacterium]